MPQSIVAQLVGIAKQNFGKITRIAKNPLIFPYLLMIAFFIIPQGNRVGNGKACQVTKSQEGMSR